MLVLTRKPGQGVILDGCVSVRVLGMSGGRVRIGIDAPRTISITRSKKPRPSAFLSGVGSVLNVFGGGPSKSKVRLSSLMREIMSPERESDDWAMVGDDIRRSIASQAK